MQKTSEKKNMDGVQLEAFTIPHPVYERIILQLAWQRMCTSQLEVISAENLLLSLDGQT